MAVTDQNIFVMVFLSIFSLFIVTSNSCVCLLVISKRALRTTTNWLMVSLAVSDILIGGVLLPVYLIEPFSIVTGYLVSVILLSGVANLCAVTYDRYVAVIKPLEYPYRAPKIRRRAPLLSWLLSLIYSLLPLFWNTDVNLTVHKVYMICLQVFGIIVPYTLMTLAYVRMFMEVRRGLTRNEHLKSFRVHNHEGRRLSSDAKVAKVFAIFVLAFLLCWLPIIYITTAKIVNRDEVIPEALSVSSLFTVATCSLLNPLVYTFLKPDFKKAICNFFRTRSPTNTVLNGRGVSSEGGMRTKMNVQQRNLEQGKIHTMEDISQFSLDCKWVFMSDVTRFLSCLKCHFYKTILKFSIFKEKYSFLMYFLKRLT